MDGERPLPDYIPAPAAEEPISFEPPEPPAAGSPGEDRPSFEPGYSPCLTRAVEHLATAVEARGDTIRRLQSTPPPRPSA